MESPSFYLEGVVKEKNEMSDFEGPLSLILMLLQKNKIEIRDVKIGDIVDQYLEYLNRLQSLDLEIASEFVRMASYLLYIKARSLLAGSEEISEMDALIESLEALKSRDMLQQIRAVAPGLLERYKTGMLYLTKPAESIEVSGEYRYQHDPADLLEALARVFTATNELPPDEGSTIRNAIPHKIAYSIKDKSRSILEMLRDGKVRLFDVYSGCETRSELIAAFMSVLEMCSMGSIMLTAGEDSNDYEIEFTGGDIDSIIEKIEET